jgi:hypothetical protein
VPEEPLVFLCAGLIPHYNRREAGWEASCQKAPLFSYTTPGIRVRRNIGMAAKWDVEFSQKENDIVVDHNHILEEQKKAYKGLLVIKVFQVHVEVPIHNPPPKTQLLVAAAKGAAEALQARAVKEVDDLAKELKDLQKEEKLGNAKAADTAQKLVEKAEKSLKNLADEFGGEIRKATQKALIGNTKQKLSSTSRSMFRGLELDEDAFEGDVGGEVPSFFGDIVKSLVAAANEAAKLSGEEGDLRLALAAGIKDTQAAIVKQYGSKEVDLSLYAKNNAKEVQKIAQLQDKYVDFLKTFEGKLDTALKALDKLEKLSSKESGLKDNKDVKTEYSDYRGAADTILKTFAGKQKAASLADRLFSDDWRSGATFVAASKELEKQPTTLKSGKNMQEAAKALEKLAKE